MRHSGPKRALRRKPQRMNLSPVEAPEATERAPGEPRSTRRAVVLKPGTYHLRPFRDYEDNILLTACGRPTWPGNPSTEHFCQQRGYAPCKGCRVAWDGAEKRWEESPARREELGSD